MADSSKNVTSTSKLQTFLSQRSKNVSVAIEWKNINYYVRIKDSNKSKFLKPVYNNKKVLDGLSGKARSGELLAIMGPTGSYRYELKY